MAIATTGTKVGIFGWQGSRLDLEDGICGGILRRDGSAALAFSHKWALGGQRAWANIEADRLTVASGSYSLDSFCRWAYSSSEGYAAMLRWGLRC
jgi:hypothetical protein